MPKPRGEREIAPRAPTARDATTPATFRLAIGPDGVGLELERPITAGCLRIMTLTTALRSVRFPVDVSGGVARFRHRRGELVRADVELEPRAFEAWAAPRLRGIVSERTPAVWTVLGVSGAVVCVAEEPGPDDGGTRAAPVLAFDIHAVAEDEDLWLVVAGARGADLPAPPTALAIACVTALVGRAGKRTGSAFRIARVGLALARAVFPDAGARAPSTEGVRCDAIAPVRDAWSLSASRGASATAASRDAVLALEGARRLAAADDALADGDVDRARNTLLASLERAPRDPATLRRLAEIDAHAGGRDEAALATLNEIANATSAPLGVLHGDLRGALGDDAGAVAAYERAGEDEPAPALAARAYERAARRVRDPERAAALLDRALARAPRSTRALWARVDARVTLGRLEDAIADVEHAEALARGARAKYGVWMRGGRTWQRAGLASRAGDLYERALRFAPDEPSALAGLGLALLGPRGDDRRAAQGVSLLARALERAQSRGEPTSRIELDLARALAESLEDLPAAIAHVSAVPNDAAELVEARALEGRWRARLGDLAGASLAFAQARDRAASAAPARGDAHARDDVAGARVAWLLEAARFERETRRDLLAAQRHLAVAVRLRPHDDTATREYRAVGRALLGDPAEAPTSETSARVGPHGAIALPADAPTPAGELRGAPAAAEAAALAPMSEDEKAARVEELTRRLQGDPTDDAVADELARLLEDLGRGHELLALLSARIEDASPGRRARLLPHFRSTLARLAQAAEQAGRHEEASLFRGVLAAP